MIKIGFIGVGFIAQLSHLKCFSALPNVKIAAVCDKDETLLRTIADKYDVCTIYTNHHEMLKDENIDAVIVTLSRYFSAKIYLDVIESKKALFAEKPISLSVNYAERLKKAQRGTHSPVHVGYMRRFDSGVLKFKELADELMLQGNRLKRIDAFCYMGNSYFEPFGIHDQYDRSYASKKSDDLDCIGLPEGSKFAYDFFLNTFSHTLDLINYLTGHQLALRYSSIDAKGHGTILAKNDLCSEIVLATNSLESNQWHEGISFTFSDRILKLNLPSAFAINQTAKVECSQFGEHEHTTRFDIKPSWAFMNQARAFVASLENMSFFQSNFDDAIEQVHFAHEVFKKNSHIKP